MKKMPVLFYALVDDAKDVVKVMDCLTKSVDYEDDDKIIEFIIALKEQTDYLDFILRCLLYPEDYIET